MSISQHGVHVRKCDPRSRGAHGGVYLFDLHAPGTQHRRITLSFSSPPLSAPSFVPCTPFHAPCFEAACSASTCTNQDQSSGSTKSSGSAGIAALAAILVVVVGVGVVYIRKLSGQVAALQRQEAELGRHYIIPMANNPMIRQQQQQQPGATNRSNVYDVGAPIVRPTKSDLPAAVELTTNPLYASSLADSSAHGTGAPLATNA